MTRENSPQRWGNLKKWLKEHEVSQVWLAEYFHISQPAISKMLSGETMPKDRYNQLVLLGIPPDLLPIPHDKTKGRKRMEPKWPNVIQPTPQASHVQTG